MRRVRKFKGKSPSADLCRPAAFFKSGSGEINQHEITAYEVSVKGTVQLCNAQL